MNAITAIGKRHWSTRPFDQRFRHSHDRRVDL